MSDARMSEALAPVRAALLHAAREEANQSAAWAKHSADETLSTAESQAEQIRAQARAQGAAEAQVYLGAQRIRTRREARSAVLQAQRDAYEALRTAARDAIGQLRADPQYPQVRQRLVDAVRRRLGEDAAIHDAAGGGVVGEVAGRRLDYSLAGVVDRAVDMVATAQEET